MDVSQNVFITAEGAAGAIADIERRKFTAEEGDHLTLLNGKMYFSIRQRGPMLTLSSQSTQASSSVEGSLPSGAIHTV